MSLPLLLATPESARDRDGPVTVTPSESVSVTDGAWRMWEGTENLVRNPLVDESLSDIAASGGSGERSTTETPDSFDASFRFTGNGTSGFQYTHFVADQPAESPGNEVRIFTQSGWVMAEEGVDFSSFFRLRGYIDGSFINNDKTEWTIGTGSWVRVSVTHQSREGQEMGTTLQAAFATSASNFDIKPSATIYMTGMQVEEKPYATPFVVGTRVPGTLTIPLAQAPASVIVRHRDAGVSVTEVVVMQDGSATFANGTGTLSHADGALTVGTTRNVDVGGVIAYPDVVSGGVVQRVAGMETWTWEVLANMGSVTLVGDPVLVGQPRIVGRPRLVGLP